MVIECQPRIHGSIRTSANSGPERLGFRTVKGQKVSKVQCRRLSDIRARNSRLVTIVVFVFVVGAGYLGASPCRTRHFHRRDSNSSTRDTEERQFMIAVMVSLDAEESDASTNEVGWVVGQTGEITKQKVGHP